MHPWPIIRMRVFHELTRRSGIHGVPHPVRRSTSDKLGLVGRHVAGLATRNPFVGRYDAMVVPHPRKPDGVEIYTDELRAALGPSTLILDSGINGTPLPGSRNLDFFTSAAGAVHARAADDRGITTALQELTGVVVPTSALLAREVPKHLRLRALYRALLKRHGIKTVYVVVAYFHQHIVGAARDLGIRVVELQHGAISPFHLGYSYPGRPAVADQPDELWCFGDYWTDVAELPAGMRTEVVGAPYLPTATAKDPKLAVFLSQGTTGHGLLQIAETVAKAHPELTIQFRLHPSEHAADYTMPAGVELSTGGNTLDLLAQATYQVGVSTTALFEGMALGCRTAVAELPGHEYLAGPIARGHALLLTTPEQLTDAPVCPTPETYYAPSRIEQLIVGAAS
ncbi:hypothetical protein [Kribbella sandramycini]|uniref:CDP-glycerol:poly(Glycerophosphate) glycerophosphotransferase n=2 Tax=Kribbella sandramycini TaxID=60450 RepID=A0A841SA69_9ACTN|nr:hypothetical protein [Kribbella sandramycini]MBB6566223.1 hypothetical protein [Kribbella sandramycini]